MRAGKIGVVRTAALPLSTLDRLAFEQTDALVTSLLDIDDQLREEGRRLADALHDVIGSPTVDKQDRRRLVGLRRALFASRSPRPEEWTTRLSTVVPGDVAARVSGWLRLHGSAVSTRAKLPEHLASELVQKSEILREIALDKSFVRATAMASRALHDEVARWAASPGRRPKTRKLSHLAVYVTRASAKTSPFSYFATSAIARWTDDGPPLTATSSSPQARLEVDAEYLDLITALLQRRPELADAVLLRLNPSAVLIESRWVFIGPPPREAIVGVPNTPAVHEAIRILGTRPGRSSGDVTAALADVAGGDVAGARRYLERLIDVGLVEVHTPVSESAVDWLGSCAAWLRGEGHGALGDVAASIEAASADLRRDLAVEQIHDHSKRCDRIRSSLTKAVADLGGVERAERPPILFENVVDPTEASLGARWWRPILDDLDTLRPWLGVFDIHLPKRAAIGHFHAERFGRGSAVPLLTLYRAVMTEVAAGHPASSRHRTPTEQAIAEAFGAADPSRSQDAMLADSPLAAFRELLEVRVRARSGLAGVPDADGIVRISPEELAEQVAEWPRWLEAPSSLAFYLQLCALNGDPNVVLNAAHGGHGRSTARLRHLLGKTDGIPPARPVSSEPRVMELAGRFGSTLNVRSPTTSRGIAYPFAAGAEITGGGLPLADLVAVHHPDNGSVHLRHARHGGRIQPAHLGLMSTEYLPPLARFVTQVFSTDWCYHPSTLAFVPHDALTDEHPVIAYSRLNVGHITIRRAGWLVSAAEVPRRRREEHDADFLVRLHRWFRTHGIPKRCFLRTWRRADSAPAKRRTRTGKPLALDIANFLLVPAFEQAIADASMVLFEEQLPTAAHGLRRGSDHFATELVLEVTAGVADE